GWTAAGLYGSLAITAGWPRLQTRIGRPLAPGILSPRKDHSQGRTSSLRCGRSTLTLIFRGNGSAAIEGNGQKSRSPLARKCQPPLADIASLVLLAASLRLDVKPAKYMATPMSFSS